MCSPRCWITLLCTNYDARTQISACKHLRQHRFVSGTGINNYSDLNARHTKPMPCVCSQLLVTFTRTSALVALLDKLITPTDIGPEANLEKKSSNHLRQRLRGSQRGVDVMKE